MKLLPGFLLAASLALNAALACFLIADRINASAAPLAAAAGATRPVRPSSPARIDPGTWATLQTNDLAALVTRLRETGFPKDTIRAILSGLINDQFAARRRALDPNNGQRPYWKDQPPDSMLGVAQSRLYREQQQALRDVLGADARSMDPLALARQRSRLGNLAPEKLAAAQLILDDCDQKRTETYYTKGTLSTEDMKRIDGELRTALAGILSSAELEEYDLRSSSTGRTLRTELSAFNPTEEEFRTIFKLRQPFDEQHGWGSGIPSPEQMQRRTEAEKLLLTQIKLQLAPERGAEYERAINSDYRRTAQLVARLELPAETTVNLWNIQKEFNELRTEVYRTPTSPEARVSRLAALQQEAIARVTPLLGSASRVESYKQYGGSWIGYLVPRPNPGR